MSTASSPSHHRVFVSHAHADNELCDRYVAALRALGLDVWYDRTNLQIGESLSETIETQLRQRTALVVIYTPASVASRWVRREVDAFQALADQDHSRLVIPVRAAECEVPLLMRGSLYADAVQNGFDATIDALASAVGVRKQEIRTQSRPLPYPVNRESRSQAEMQAERRVDDSPRTSVGPQLTPSPAPTPPTAPASPTSAFIARRRVFVPDPAPQQLSQLSSPFRVAVASAPPASPARMRPTPAPPSQSLSSQHSSTIVAIVVLEVLSLIGVLVYGHLLTSPQWAVSNDRISHTDILNSISMVSPTEGWAVGSNSTDTSGVILHYSGGLWTVVKSPSTGVLSSVTMVSATEGWAFGWASRSNNTDTSGVILHYGGGLWTVVKGPTNTYLNSIAMVSATEGWAVGDGIVHYHNGQWTQVVSGSVSGSLSDVAMVSSTEGWAVGGGPTTMHYSDGKWTQENTAAAWPLNSLAMVSPSEWWAVGADGTILHYSGGRQTVIPSPTTYDLTSIAMVSATEGWAVGDGGTILHYSGGQWSNINNSASYGELFSIAMVSATEGWAVGDGGTILHYSATY